MNNREKREYVSCLAILDQSCSVNEIQRKNEILRKSPSILYKYRSFDKYTFEMINEGYTYLSPVKDLDDPFDCVTDFDVSKYVDDKNGKVRKGFVDHIIKSNNKNISNERLKEYREVANLLGNESDSLLAFEKLREKGYSQTEINGFFNVVMNSESYFNQCKEAKIFDEFGTIAYNPGDVVGVCSLSENRDNKVMWSLYGKKYKGYCVEYEIPFTKEVRKSLYPVQYLRKSSNFTKLIYETMMADIKRNVCNNDMFLDREIENVGAIYEPFCLKDTDWKYQQEWRIIGNAKGHFTQLRIKAIYLGFDVSKTNQSKMKRLAKAKGFGLFKMNHPNGKKRITYAKIV